MDLGAIDPRKNVWVQVALVVLAMLLVPMLAWVLLPGTNTTAIAPITSGQAKSAPPAPRGSSAPRVAGRSLAGRVVDESGTAVRGASVKLEPSTKENGPRTTSDEEGAFFLDGASAASGALVASHAGFVTARLDIEAGSDRTGLVVTLKKAQATTGQVVDGEGKGIQGAVVRCEPDGVVSANSGEEGRFEIAIGADGCDAHALHADYGSSELIHLSPGGKNILELPTPGGIAGTVVDEHGAPVPLYLIAVESFAPADKQSEGMGGASKLVNDASGAFELTGLGRGKYTLTASAEGRPPTRSDSIDVESGRTTRGVRIRLDRGLVLSGIVTDRKTKLPIAGVRVALDSMTSTNANSIHPTTTGEDGSYTIDGVPAAPFSVRFSQSAYRERILSIDGRGKSELKNNVDLAPADSTGNTEMTGIGATLGQGKEYVSITGVLPDGPAEKAGVQSGDRILRIDGKSAQGFVVNDCVQRLRGPEGSSVAISLGRGDQTLEVNVTRALIVR